MDKKELEKRTKQFAISIIKYLSSMSRNKAVDVISYQLLKSATSVGANYREANRAESRKDFIHKISICEKEAAETQYWLEINNELRIGDLSTINDLLKESSELLAIFTSIGKTSKRK